MENLLGAMKFLSRVHDKEPSVPTSEHEGEQSIFVWKVSAIMIGEERSRHSYDSEKLFCKKLEMFL